MTKLTVLKSKFIRMFNPYYEWDDETDELSLNEINTPTSKYDFSDIPNLSHSYYDLHEFGYFINEENALKFFQLRDLTNCPEFLSESTSTSFVEFGWHSIEVKEQFKRRRVMSFVMLSIMHTILKYEIEKDVCFFLRNTSKEIDSETPGRGENLKVYNSILTKYEKGLQHEIFWKENRISDLAHIEQQISSEKKYLIKEYPNTFL